MPDINTNYETHIIHPKIFFNQGEKVFQINIKSGMWCHSHAAMVSEIYLSKLLNSSIVAFTGILKKQIIKIQKNKIKIKY